MSLVVLRSWSDGAPKVRAIAPPDSTDDLVYVPDHKGQFVAQEVFKKPEKVIHGAIVNDGRVENVEADEHRTDNGSDSRRNSHCSSIGNRNVIVKEGQHNDANKIHSNPENNKSHNNTPVISGNKSTDGRYSSGATIVTLHFQDHQATESQTQRTRRFNEGRNLVFNTKLDRVVLRSTSASPDQDYIQEIESTPPSSPLSGRYRNLGPDLAACIPKRQLKFGSNWMKDDPSNIGIRWSHRRNLSNSTPSLSQDFYSSEEEKISSYSSQSSSKTPSPQPPASSSSSDYLESHRSHQLNHRQHLPPQHHHSFQPKNELLVEEQEKEEFAKRPTQTIDIITQVLLDNNEQKTPVSSQSSNHQEELSQSSTRFRREKQTHLQIRPQQNSNNQNSNRGHSRRPRQRQLLSSPSTPPPPPPDQHDFYRMVTPPVTTPIINSSPSPSGIRTEIDKDDYDYNFSYLNNIKKRFEQRESEISCSENATTPKQSLVSKSDVILVEVIRKQLKQTEDGDCSSSSIQCQTSVSTTTISTRSPNGGGGIDNNDLILGPHPESSVSSISSQSPAIPRASAAYFETDKFDSSSQKKSTGDKSESDRNNTNKPLSRGSVGFSSELKFECTAQNDNIITVPLGEETQLCGSNEKLCDAEPQAEKIYLISTPQHVEQNKIPLIKSTTTTTTTTTGVKAEIEESFQEISIDETSLAATVHTNNNTQEILESKLNPVVVEKEESTEKFSLLTSPRDTSAAHSVLRSDQQKLEEEGNIRSWSSDKNCTKKAVKTLQFRHQQCNKNETDDQKGQKEETEAGNLSSKQEPPPVDIAPGASSQCTESSDSKPTPQLEGPHFCLTTSYLNLDLVEDQANESERNDITVRRSSDGSIDRRRQDQEDVPINLQQVSPSPSASASPRASTLSNLADSQVDSSEGNPDVSWSHLILNCSKTIKTSHEDEQANHQKSLLVDDGSEKSEQQPVNVSHIIMPLNSSITVDTVNRTEVSKLESEDKSFEIDVTNNIDSSKELKLKLETTHKVTQTQVKQENRNEEGSENNNCEIVVGIHQEQHSSEAESDSDTRSFHGEPKSKLKLKTEENIIIMDRGNNVEGPSPIATVKIPVQAVNKHVRSDSGDEIDVDAIWRNSTVRDSFRGFCQELLESSSNGSSQDLSTKNSHVPENHSEKIIIHVPQPQSQPQSLLPSQGVNEGVIEFEDDEVENDDDRCSSDLSSNGGSDTHPIQQCNNSIEYISVLDNIQVHGAVNRIDCNLGKTGINSNGDHYNVHPKPTKWIISLDLGSHASGFSYWFHGEPNVVHIGSWSGDNCFHKIPSWILTVNDSNITKIPSSIEKLPQSINSSIKVGQDALDEYTEKRGHISSLTFVSQWREFFEHDSESARRLTFPYTLQSLDDVDFTQLVTALIHFFGLAAISQIQAKFGNVFDKGEPIEWLLTIPTCWNSKSRQGMREAASKSGAVKSSDGVNLIEDPMAASFFAAMCGEYENFLAVDVGGSFLHYSGFELQNGRMHQTVEARSLHLPTPELTFETLLTQIVSQEFILYYKAKYRPGWIEIMKNFGKAKCKFDNCSFMHHSSAFVFVPSSFVIEFNCYTGMEIAECIQEQNTGIKWNDNGALCIPHSEMKMILKPTLDFVINKIDFVLDAHLFDNIVLTGGLARSKFLKESISQKFPELKLIMPKEFPNGVLQGATLSLMPNIQPKLVIKSPFSIGVGVMTPFDAVLHPEVKKIVKDGKAWCADVWDTLIKFDQEMELNSVINKRSYVGAQPGQSCLVLPLFKSCHSSIPNLVTDQSVVKCCELRFESTKTWQEIELILTCRASELIVMAVDRENVVHRVVIDFM